MVNGFHGVISDMAGMFCFTISFVNFCNYKRIFREVFKLGKIISRQGIEIFFLFFTENCFWHFMQIVCSGDKFACNVRICVLKKKVKKKYHQFVSC